MITRRKFIADAQKAALTAPFLSLAGCSDPSRQAAVTLAGKTMGTTYSVKLADPRPGLHPDELAKRIDDILEAVNQQMSTYRPDSEISRFNDAAEGQWFPVSKDTRIVVAKALAVATLTDGAFDPTVGPIVDLWGFGARGDRRTVPTAEAITKARALVGHEKIETRNDPPAIRKRASGLRLDLSAVAKGFGVDKVASLLDAAGAENYLVEIGGELRTRGHGPGKRPWRVGIEKPQAGKGGLQRVVSLQNEALATSGNYRIFFDADGKKYSHILDPRTGRPVTHDLASATVVTKTAMEADALSTSLLVLGPNEGLSFAKKHDVAAFFVAGTEDALRESASPIFAARFMT